MKVVNPASSTSVGLEVIEQSIVAIADGMKAIRATRLKRDTIIDLLHESCGVGKRDIKYVLEAMDRIEADHLKPRTP